MAMAAAAAVAAGNRCMNAACGAAAPGVGEWRKGWPLRSGGFAVLCDKCGLAYEQLVFCDIFHQKESGWRDCSFCGKRLHCGCIASKYSFDLLDSGGVQCVTCIKNSAVKSSLSQMTSKLLTPQNNQRLFGKNDELMPGKILEIGHSNIISKQKEVENGIRQIKWEHPNISIAEMGRMPFLTMNQRAPYSSQCTPRDDNKDPTADSVRSESFSEACLSMSLGIANNGNKVELTSTLGRPVLVSPSTAIPDGREFAGALSPSQHAQKARHFLARPSRVGDCAAFDPMKDVLPHFRVARPPAEGKGRNQLLPRYWPRITDQELQQISGDSNSTIVPLFEKVLSASDAGRIGRLVLPKACAEAYFPPITQPEGRPLTIQDAKGKEWHFQFRFWPNNNSRMYVLEGVTPCIQSLQLQAGDTVTFSRIEPGGRLVMGFRKATNNINLPDSQISAIANGSLISETFFSSTYENLAIVSGFSGFLQSIKRAADIHSSSLSEHVNSADGDVSWLKTDKFGGRPDEGSFQLLQKRSRNIGSKSRRLLMDAEDVLELKLTWEEAQELLRPAPTAKPSVVMVEDYEFEEYDEPPVFAKRSIFTIRASGEQDQWIQCDDCSKWRQLPLNVIVASRWTCADKSSDPKRSPCSAPDELNSKQLQSILQQYEDIRRRKSSYSFKQNVAEIDACSFDAFATAAVLGDVANQAAASVATTTKHPRHRPGCTCIVCIQPPSGKGLKHNPACTCNVCMTVKRRYKTLMMRKKQRQSEREEAESSKKIPWMSKDEPEGSNLSRSPQTLDASRDGDVTMLEKHDINKGHIDLNFQPTGRDVDLQGGQPPVGMMTLLEVANRPLENYLKQNGLITLVGEQGSSSTGTVPQAPMESEERTSNMERLASVDQKRLEREQDSVGIDDAGENQDKDVTGAA